MMSQPRSNDTGVTPRMMPGRRDLGAGAPRFRSQTPGNSSIAPTASGATGAEATPHAKQQGRRELGAAPIHFWNSGTPAKQSEIATHSAMSNDVRCTSAACRPASAFIVHTLHCLARCQVHNWAIASEVTGLLDFAWKVVHCDNMLAQCRTARGMAQ